MLKNIKISRLQIFFYLFIFLILFEGWFCKYSAYRINAEGSICQIFFINFWSESGFVETAQIIFIFISFIYSISLCTKSKKNFEKKFFFFISFCLFYYFGEEISWGQHYLKFETPTLLEDINNQKEFNLHNISNLFDQIPRSVTFLICGFSFLIFYIKAKFFKFGYKYNYLILPNKNLIYVSFLLLLVSFPDIINDKLNIQLSKKIDNYIYELITFNFIRLSELQELIFSFYILNYMIAIKNYKF